MKRKFLGVPILAVILAVVLMAGGVLAGVMMTKEIPSTATVVLPYDVSAWQDAGCTVELTKLDFGKVLAGDTSTWITFYLRNDGEKPVYIAIDQTGLAEHLTLRYDKGGSVYPVPMYSTTSLQPNNSMAVKLSLLADSTATKGAVTFKTVVSGSDIPY